jgi:hypothetical protein
MAHDDDSAVRLTARDALVCLQHIPDNGDPMDTQELDRLVLALTLGNLKADLEAAAREAAPH